MVQAAAVPTQSGVHVHPAIAQIPEILWLEHAFGVPVHLPVARFMEQPACWHAFSWLLKFPHVNGVPEQPEFA